MKHKAISLILASLLGATSPLFAATPVEAPRHATIVATPDPAQQVRDMARLIRNNDLNGLLRASVPPSAYQQLRAAYDLHRLEPISAADRTEFAEHLAKFNAPNAVDQLMTEIEPKLVEARPKVPGALLMGLGALQMAAVSEDSDLTADQRQSLQQALPALQQWATTTDFLSSLSMRQALTLVTDAVRSSGIRSVDELKSMPFEQILAKAESVVAAGKQALLIYGLDVDAITDTMQVELLAINGTTARVRTTVTVFNAPVSRELELVLVEGHWYGKEAIVQWSAHSEANAQG